MFPSCYKKDLSFLVLALRNQMSIPHLFRCPISLDLFTDPVTLSTGQTYDRPSIEKWLAAGNSTCPVTMQTLHDTSLLPNHTLRHLIDRWLITGPDVPNSNLSALSLSSLKDNLQSPDTNTATKIEILKKIKILSSESDIGRACLIQLGLFRYLIKILFLDQELVELVLDCVLNILPSTQLESLNMLKKESKFESLVLLFDQGNLRIKISLCRLIETISTSVVTHDLCAMLGQNSRVLRVIVSLLHSQNVRSSEAAAKSLHGICSVVASRAGAVREGAVDGLVSFLARSNNGGRALATLEVLVGLEGGKKALIKNPNSIKILVKYVFRASSMEESGKDNEGCESAVGTLLIACCESGKVRSDAVSCGVLMQLLLLLQSQCGTKAKAKGRALLMLMRSLWGREPGMGGNLHHFK